MRAQARAAHQCRCGNGPQKRAHAHGAGNPSQKVLVVSKPQQIQVVQNQEDHHAQAEEGRGCLIPQVSACKTRAHPIPPGAAVEGGEKSARVVDRTGPGVPQRELDGRRGGPGMLRGSHAGQRQRADGKQTPAKDHQLRTPRFHQAELQPELVLVGVKQPFHRGQRVVLGPELDVIRQGVDFRGRHGRDRAAKPCRDQVEGDGFEPAERLGMALPPRGPEGIVGYMRVQEICDFPGALRGQVAVKQVHQQMQRGEGEQDGGCIGYPGIQYGDVQALRAVDLAIAPGELFALLVAEKALQQYRGTTFERPLLSAFKKMAASLPDTISLNLADWEQTISFRTSAEPILKVQEACRKVKPQVLVIDSIQTVSHPEFPGSCGTVGQVRESAAELRRTGSIPAVVYGAHHDATPIVISAAAFEKILRERQVEKVQRQRLLMPMLVELKPQQMVVFASIADELERNGFEVEPFGPQTLAVKSAPVGLEGAMLERMLAQVIEQCAGDPEEVKQNEDLTALRTRIAASIACHSAIKVNTPLDPVRMEWLLSELAKTEHPTSCPHGRPIALLYSWKEILRAFHRI